MIDARQSKLGDKDMYAADFDIIFKNTGSMPFVRFPHLPHTEWLTCANCHPAIFLPRKGRTRSPCRTSSKANTAVSAMARSPFPHHELWTMPLRTARFRRAALTALLTGSTWLLNGCSLFGGTPLSSAAEGTVVAETATSRIFLKKVSAAAGSAMPFSATVNCNR